MLRSRRPCSTGISKQPNVTITLVCGGFKIGSSLCSFQWRLSSVEDAVSRFIDGAVSQEELGLFWASRFVCQSPLPAGVHQEWLRRGVRKGEETQTGDDVASLQSVLLDHMISRVIAPGQRQITITNKRLTITARRLSLRGCLPPITTQK